MSASLIPRYIEIIYDEYLTLPATSEVRAWFAERHGVTLTENAGIALNKNVLLVADCDRPIALSPDRLGADAGALPEPIRATAQRQLSVGAVESRGGLGAPVDEGRPLKEQRAELASKLMADVQQKLAPPCDAFGCTERAHEVWDAPGGRTNRCVDCGDDLLARFPDVEHCPLVTFIGVEAP